MMNQYDLLIIVAIALIAGVSDAHPPKKIVGGERAEVGEFPYQVLLRAVEGRTYWICGGAIISSRHVLTARHCVDSVQYPYTNLTVLTGSIEYDVGQFHRVKAIHYYADDVVHHNPVIHDIAIIELNDTIALNNSTQKIVELTDGYIDFGSTANITGWGRLNENVLGPSRYLMKLSVTCTGSNMPHGNIIYARDATGTGPCFGDSGGPLVRNNRLVGIAAAVSVGCAKGYYDSYISVVYYNNWIREVMERE